MTEDELKNWFWNMFCSCYPIKHDDYPERTYFLYDKLYLRKCYLLNLIGRKLEFPTEIKGNCLFEINSTNGYLWCNNEIIWNFLEKNYSSNYIDVQSLIEGWFEEYDNIKVIVRNPRTKFWISLMDKDKLTVQISYSFGLFDFSGLIDNDKLKLKI
jgi:hypothetical protein